MSRPLMPGESISFYDDEGAVSVYGDEEAVLVTIRGRSPLKKWPSVIANMFLPYE